MSKLSGLRWALSTFAARMRLRCLGVEVGCGTRFLGQPILSKSPGSQISFGAGVVLTSLSVGTALGVRGPVIIRTLSSGALISIGDDVGMSGTVICAARSVSIGKRCLIGADCMIFDTDFHHHEVGGGATPYRRFRAPEWPTISQAVTIEDDVFLGARSLVCKGVTIGAGSIVAAGSVVTRNLPPRCVAAGSPARFLKWLQPDGDGGMGR